MTKGLATTAILAASFALSACMVHQSETPPLGGPSDFAQSILVTASPDRITQDGQSQSSIGVRVIGPTGQGASGVAVRLDMLVGGVLADFGTLSTKSVVTGSDGRASAVYTAPAAPPPTLNSGTNTITIRAIALGSNAQISNAYSADIRLVPPGVILPPADTPTASFTVSPSAPVVGNAAIFDASKSCPGGTDSNGNCLSGFTSIVSYAWSFGDGTSASGKVASHSFGSAGTFAVTLTVTNDRGLAASTTQPVTVGALGGLTAQFNFSPATPLVNTQVQFNASASQAAPGHSIVRYTWNWGDGDPSVSSGSPLQQHDYGLPGSYNVTLTVTDDTGQTATATVSVSIGSGAPTAAFTVAVTNPLTHTIQANGLTSTAVAPAIISTYSWSWGDLSAPSGGSIASHTYALAGTYPVTLTVTDSLGRSGTVTQSVTVP